MRSWGNTLCVLFCNNHRQCVTIPSIDLKVDRKGLLDRARCFNNTNMHILHFLEFYATKIDALNVHSVFTSETGTHR